MCCTNVLHQRAHSKPVGDDQLAGEHGCCIFGGLGLLASMNNKLHDASQLAKGAAPTQSGMTSSPANSELKAQVEMWVV